MWHAECNVEGHAETQLDGHADKLERTARKAEVVEIASKASGAVKKSERRTAQRCGPQGGLAMVLVLGFGLGSRAWLSGRRQPT
jgi:hypothetical protein